LQKIGVDDFIGHLGVMNVSSLHADPGYYGLSVAIGGLEMTPLELSSLYVTLANDGQYRDLTWLKSDTMSSEMTVFSPGAVWLTRRALSIKDRPDFPSRRSLHQMPPSIHWKTGTSFGHKDAWAVGSGPEITALVWLGNANQRSARGLVGAEAAGPILFDLLEAVGGEDAPHVPPPTELIEVEVCAYSGRLPISACPYRRTVLAIETAVPSKPCPYHVAVEVDQRTGQAVGPGCRGDGEVGVETFVQWPASVRRWLGDEHRRLPETPRYAEGCEVGGVRTPPRVISPQAGQVTLLIPGVSADRQEIPLEADAAQQGPLTWFVDGLYLGERSSDDRMWWLPTVGRHQVVVMDETGASSSLWFEVEGGR
jgi:penicillin-binding protein 1C